MEPFTSPSVDSAALLASFANGVEASLPVMAAFIAASVEIGRGESGLTHLAERVAAGRTRVSDWFDGVVDPAALEVLRLGEDAGDLVSATRLTAAAAGSRLYS